MNFPKNATDQIDQWISLANTRELSAAQQTLTMQYQQLQSPTLNAPPQHLAYLATRMPAIYSVCQAVFSHLHNHQSTINSVLDLGAGPGTASLASLSAFTSLAELTLVDRNPGFLKYAQGLLRDYPQKLEYHQQDLATFKPSYKYDLVVCSYALNELSKNDVAHVIDQAWQATGQFLALIEPGTPTGFSLLKAARQQLLNADAFLVAPCPHHSTCSLSDKDWCHFSERIERSPRHRQVKGGTLPYEDEKYTFLIASRHPVPRAKRRIIKRPIKNSGHVIFDLCTEMGVKREIVTKSKKERYALARHKRWGDAWDEHNG